MFNMQKYTFYILVTSGLILHFSQIDGISGKTYTYNEFTDIMKRVASGLVKLGVQKGDVFAVYSMNSPEFKHN